jgi:hypothetical protein
MLFSSVEGNMKITRSGYSALWVQCSGKINNQVADCRQDSDGEGPEARTGLLNAFTYMCVYIYTGIYIYRYNMYYREQKPEILHS